MDLEDRITIRAPEGIELELVLAGAGSRLLAGMIDFILQLLFIVLCAIVAFVLVGGGFGVALFAIAAFLGLYGYDVLFELLAGGQTPGKRLTHLRVVRRGGDPVDLPSSVVRNLLRVLDVLPSFYLIGIVSILLTRHNQRLGDLAAGTVVIREPAATKRRPGPLMPVALPDTTRWDVSAVNIEELSAVRRFLERRDTLRAGARRTLALQLAQGLREKVAAAPDDLDPERFLEALVEAKSVR